MEVGQFFNQFSWAVADSRALHPLAQGAVHDQTQETNKNMSLHPLGRFMPDRTISLSRGIGFFIVTMFELSSIMGV